jgi:hypothetical protein
MSSVSGFWSYTHSDNDGEGGRIIRLSELIRNEYKLQTSESLNLFLDKSNIRWGQEWEKTLDDALIETTFLIPIVTPSYLASPACRKEAIAFSGKAQSLGFGEFLLPIIYVAPRSFDGDEVNDDVVTLIKRTQWQDWRRLRLLDEQSAEHRQAVTALVERIVEIVDGAASAAPLPLSPSAISVDEDDSLGYLDILGETEAAMPRWAGSMEALGEVVQKVDIATRSATEDLARSDRIGGGASGRLRAVRDYSSALTPLAETIDQLGTSFAASTVEVDAGITLLLSQVLAGNYQRSEQQELDKFFEIIVQSASQVRPAVDSLSGFAGSLESWPGLSRDLRRPARLIRNGLQQFRDGMTVFEAWVSTIDEIRQRPDWESGSS